MRDNKCNGPALYVSARSGCTYEDALAFYYLCSEPQCKDDLDENYLNIMVNHTILEEENVKQMYKALDSYMNLIAE